MPDGERAALDFHGGTLRLRGLPEGGDAPPGAVWDAREALFRALAHRTMRA